MLNRKGHGGISGGIMSQQFGAFTVFNLLPTREQDAMEPIPEDAATDLELAFGGLSPERWFSVSESGVVGTSS